MIPLVPAGSEAGVQGQGEPRREGQNAGKKAGDVQPLRMPLKNTVLNFSLFEGLQGNNAADGYFCSQKTSKS